MPGNNLKLADKYAVDYDNSITNDNWIGPQILYLLLNERLQPKSKIVDLGIGTGASSRLFQLDGHLITGIDGSEKMLEICRAKNIAENLLMHDLETPPFPIKDKVFNAAISNGVFHLVHPIKPIFKEVKRILVPGGYFAFTFEKTTALEDSTEIEPDIWQKKTKTGVLTYKHSTDYIFSILKENDFEPILQTEFLAFSNNEIQKEFYFTAIAAKLQ
ncbi:MAG: class I SAM-dependent methyltransferase [Prolixibacteraceae bacterium]|nr:class I SAM-dependent methyltransferase [Prolixibacteraceae bacterium]